MKDTRKPYHLADGVIGTDKKYRTYCGRYVLPERLVGKHMVEHCRICNECRRILMLSTHHKWEIVE